MRKQEMWRLSLRRPRLTCLSTCRDGSAGVKTSDLVSARQSQKSQAGPEARSLVNIIDTESLQNLGFHNVTDTRLCHDLYVATFISADRSYELLAQLTGIETVSMISLIILGSDMRATPPSRLMSEGTRSRACVSSIDYVSELLWLARAKTRLSRKSWRTDHDSASTCSFGNACFFSVHDVHYGIVDAQVSCASGEPTY